MLIKEGLTERILAGAIEVHKNLGPGLLESVYEACLCKELLLNGIQFERQKDVPVIYKGERIDFGYRLDIVVCGEVIIELKAVEALTKVHEAQLLTYMKLSEINIGLLMNFNVLLMKDGIKRFVL
jgi:GxxExxY protein